MVDLNYKIRRVIETIVLIVIIMLSLLIFIYRDKFHDVSNVSYLGLFVLCFLANATVLLPSPSLMIAASCALIMNPLIVAFLAALGSTLGEVVGYTFGNVSKDLSSKFRETIHKLTSKIHNEGIIVFIFAVLPLPLFDVVGIYSGGIKMNLLKFLLFCFIGKFIKMLIYTRIYNILDWLITIMPDMGGLL